MSQVRAFLEADPIAMGIVIGLVALAALVFVIRRLLPKRPGEGTPVDAGHRRRRRGR